MSEPNSASQGSDGEANTTAPNENESYNNSATNNESAGDNAWEVVSTSNEPATSIDGAHNSSAEAYVVESTNAAGAAAAAGVSISYY